MIASVEQRKRLVKTMESAIFDAMENGRFHCLHAQYILGEVWLTRIL